MQKLPLPEKFEPMLEGYTTDLAEANAVVTGELLECIDTLARQASQLKHQAEHWEDKLAYAASAIYERCREAIISSAVRRELPAEAAYDAAHQKARMDITKSDPISEDITSLNRQFELEYFDDKCVVTVPCCYDLFETRSIFEPALADEDGRFLYSLMQCLNAVTLHLNRVSSA
jgi:hypothetical protein